MCGIFGYTGLKNDAPKTVLKGLKTLEYRGYDSWGVAAKIIGKNGKSHFFLEKKVGKIGSAVLPLDFRNSSLSIGHTRWATHGGVTKINAHPHLDCSGSIAVVHNGIIENFESLKNDLLKKGHNFISDTDTEVIPHLIEEYLKKMDFTSAVKNAFNKLTGLNAIVVAYAGSDEIIAVKNGSPLVVGIGKKELYVASDVSGIVSYTKKVVFLKDNEMAVLGKDFQVFSLPDGKMINPKFEKINWTIEYIDKGKFKHFMIKEIYEQPKVIRNIINNYSDQILSLSKKVEKAKGTFFIGAGTAYNAGLAGTYLFSKFARLHINTAFASEFNYLEDFLNKRSLVIALSQSGETIDVIEPLARAKRKGSTIAAITNAPGSTIHRMADYKLLLNAGYEKAVASTKAYTAKLSVLSLLTFAMTGKIDEAKSILVKTAMEIERILSDENEKIKKIALKLNESPNVYVIGRGVSYSSALEASLKIKEVSYMPSEGLAGGELKHGPIALVTKGTPCIVFAPKDETYSSIISNATEIKTRGGVMIGIAPQNSSAFDYWIEVKDLSFGTYVAQIVVVQLIAYYLALSKSLDPDMPRNLAKSVTVK